MFPKHDKEKLRLLNSRFLEYLDSEAGKEKLEELRSGARSQVLLERELVQPLYEELSVDAAWHSTISMACAEDEGIAEQDERIAQLLSFSPAGPMALVKGDVLDVELELEEKGYVLGFIEAAGSYEIRLQSGEVVKAKPCDLKKYDEKRKVMNVLKDMQEQVNKSKLKLDMLRAVCHARTDAANESYFNASKRECLQLESVCEGYAVDLPWILGTSRALSKDDPQVEERRANLEASMSINFLNGPKGFVKGDCVRVDGLSSDAGKLMNGQVGVIKNWFDDKGRFEVRLVKVGTDNNFKPENLMKIEDIERLRSIEELIVMSASSAAIQAQFDACREKCPQVPEYTKVIRNVVPQLADPISKLHGVNLAWRSSMLAAYGDDAEICSFAQQMDTLTSFGTIGSHPLQRGSYYEVHGLEDENASLNGTPVLLRCWDKTKELYEASPADDRAKELWLTGDHFRPLDEKTFASLEEAKAFQDALREVYASPETRAMIEGHKDKKTDKRAYMQALIGELPGLQKPVLEKFGFHTGIVGMLHLAKANIPWEVDPDFAQANKSLDRMVGMSELRFDGKVAIVTGGGRGLGRKHCLLLASRGAMVVVNNRTKSKADEVVDEIKAMGGKAVADYNDIAKSGDKVVETALTNFKQLDIVICNAGQLEDHRFENMTMDDFTQVMDTHVTGHVRLLKEAWPHFIQRQCGRIVLISSESGMHGNIGQANYAAAKAALLGLGQTLAMEGREHGILTNMVCTEGLTRMINGLKPVAYRLSDTDLAKQPQSASMAVAWLCHDMCKTTGGIFQAGDGGAIRPSRWQKDQGFVDFDTTLGDGGLESVADRWHKAKYETVNYPGEEWRTLHMKMHRIPGGWGDSA